MPYLKSSQVTGLSPKPLDVTGFTQSASENLEGTYSQHEVLLADAFNVTDDVTISDNLILAKLSDDGNAITVTGGSTTRTISGSGSLEGSTFAQTPNASLTGMAGTIGSAVALDSATFPAGHVLQCVSTQLTAVASSSSAGAGNSSGGAELAGYNVTITPSSTSNKILIVATMGAVSGTGNALNINLFRDSTWVGMADAVSGHFKSNTRTTGNWNSNFDHCYGSSLSFLDSPSTTSATTYKIYMACESGTGYVNRSSTDNSTDNYTYTARASSTITAWEIVA